MGYGKRATWDEIREKASGQLQDSYTTVGDSVTKSVRVVKFANLTDVDIYFTDDGSTDKIKLAPKSYEVWDCTANKAMADLPQFIEVGTDFSARYETGSAPTTGWVSIECLIVESGS